MEHTAVNCLHLELKTHVTTSHSWSEQLIGETIGTLSYVCHQNVAVSVDGCLRIQNLMLHTWKNTKGINIVN